MSNEDLDKVVSGEMVDNEKEELSVKVPMKRNFFPQNYRKMCEYECLIRKTG